MTNSILSQDQYEAAVRYITEHARPLERMLFLYEFQAGDSADVLRELMRFQNPDGGFGHGLEPDIRCSASSVLATTVALQRLEQVQAGSDEPLVQSAIRYLAETYNTVQDKGWDIVPPEVESAPRAPWWNYNAAHNGWGNPAIEIAGHFHHYRELVPIELLDALNAYAVHYMNEVSSRKDFHELLCCLRFAKLVPQSVLQQVKHSLDEMVANCVTMDPNQWNGYCLTPIQVAESPDSAYYDALRSSIDSNLAHLSSQQQEEGSWAPPWSWGQFEDVWPAAEREWKGVLTLEALRTLKAYGIVSP